MREAQTPGVVHMAGEVSSKVTTNTMPDPLSHCTSHYPEYIQSTSHMPADVHDQVPTELVLVNPSHRTPHPIVHWVPGLCGVQATGWAIFRLTL